jgi:heptosyltransferase-2
VNSERLWIRLPNWLGDALMSRPLLHSLGVPIRGARLRIAGPAGVIELLAAEGGFEHAEPWPADARGRGALMQRVRAWRPTAALVLPPSFSSAFEALRSGAPRRIGFAGDSRSPLLTDAVKRPPRGDLHLAAEYLRLGMRLRGLPGGRAEATTLEPLDRALALPSLPVAPAAQVAARERRAAAGLAGERLALLAPGALYGPAKRWDAARFAELGRRLAARGFAIAVCGTGAEAPVCEAVTRAIGGGAASLAGRTTLAELAGLCAGAALAVCNDSGFAHLAAAIGVPTVVLFGSTSSAWTAPLGARVRVLQHAPVCSPCFQRRCRIGYACLTAIEVDEVESACLLEAA